MSSFDRRVLTAGGRTAGRFAGTPNAYPQCAQPNVSGHSRPVLCDGGRSCTPLRHSPGFSPGSLSRSVTNVPRWVPTPWLLATTDQLRSAAYSAACRDRFASASATGVAPLLNSMVRAIVESSASAVATTSAASARETSFPAPTTMRPVAGSRVSRPGPSTVQARSLARRCASAAALDSA